MKKNMITNEFQFFDPLEDDISIVSDLPGNYIFHIARKE